MFSNISITFHRHPVRHQWIKCNNLSPCISNNLTVRIPPKKQLRHQDLTQEYTAVICIAVLSFTLFPEVLPPIKNEYTLPEVLSVGASLPRNNLLNTLIIYLHTKRRLHFCKCPLRYYLLKTSYFFCQAKRNNLSRIRLLICLFFMHIIYNILRLIIFEFLNHLIQNSLFSIT